MSIRLRLTLLYIGILALTLIGFSAILYVIQSQATLETTKTTLARQAQEMANAVRRFPPRPDSTLPTTLRPVDSSALYA